MTLIGYIKSIKWIRNVRMSTWVSRTQKHTWVPVAVAWSISVVMGMYSFIITCAGSCFLLMGDKVLCCRINVLVIHKYVWICRKVIQTGMSIAHKMLTSLESETGNLKSAHRLSILWDASEQKDASLHTKSRIIILPDRRKRFT